MGQQSNSWNFSPRHWVALSVTGITFVVALLASINLYLLEDNSSLTSAAYSASSLLRWSYDGVYLSALVAGVALCGIVVYAIVRSNTLAIGILMTMACFVALAGFGGLLIRHASTFLVLFMAFAIVAIVSFLAGRMITIRLQTRLSGRSSDVLGACVSTGVALLINVVCLVVHTLMLNPVSHALYMQGQMGSLHFDTLLVAMRLELIAFVVCALWLGFILLVPAAPPVDEGR